MDRRGTSVLLIPLLGFLALLYPIANQRTAPAPVAGAQGSTAKRSQAGTRTLGKKYPNIQWKRDRALLDEFLGPLPGPEGQTPQENREAGWQDGDQRKDLTIGFIVATVPDPVDSGLPYMFDRFMSAIEAAIAADGYVLDRFDMPWLDAPRKTGAPNKKQENTGKQGNNSEKESDASPDGEQNRRFESQPGVILFRRSYGLGATTTPSSALCTAEQVTPHDTDKYLPDVLALYLVGETPTSGVQKNALIAALQEIEWFSIRSKNPADTYPRGYPRSVCSPLKFMGPSFTGSVASVEFTLNSWINAYQGTPKPYIQLISGSATSVDTKTNFLFGGGQSHFSATAVPDRVTIPRLLKYFKDIEPNKDKGKVAFLIEGNTAYGQSGKQGGKSSRTNLRVQKKSAQAKVPEEESADFTMIPFPLHISQLRAASEKQRKEQQAASQSVVRSPLLELPLEDADERHDSIRALSELDLPSAEQIVSNLLSTVSRDGFHFVGIMATDARDTMFLAQEIHEHNPSAVLFTVNPDLLYLHPEINPATRGMLIFTSYPLFNANQLWSFPYSTGVRLQFPDHAAEGAYNATLALLNRPDLLADYGVPFSFLDCTDVHKDCGPSWPPLWISVVGRDALWPLAYEPVNWQDISGHHVEPSSEEQPSSDPEGQHAPYLRAITIPAMRSDDDYRPDLPSLETLRETWARGIYPQTTSLALVLFSFLCAFFCLMTAWSRMRNARPVLAVGKCVKEDPPEQGMTPGKPESSLLIKQQGFRDAGFLKPFGATVFASLHRQGEQYLLAGIASLGFFQFIALVALALPAIGLLEMSPSRAGLSGLVTPILALPWPAKVAGSICVATLAILAVGAYVLFVEMNRRPAENTADEKSAGKSRESILWHRIPIVAATLVMIGLTCWLAASWLVVSGEHVKVAKSLFIGLRLLNLQSGVSAVPPLFFISLVAFLWAFNSFQRARQLENLEGWKGIFGVEKPSLGGMRKLEERVQHYLHCPSAALPGAKLVIAAALVTGTYLFRFRLVRSFEATAFFYLLGFSITFMNMALWLGILRFCLIWRALEAMLRLLSWHPLRGAYKSYRSLFPAMPRIDLTTPPATTASLAYSVQQARALGQTLLSGGAQLAGGFTPQFQANIDTAYQKLSQVTQAEAAGDWREALCLECDAQQSLAEVSKEVAGALEDCEWLANEPATGKLAALPKEKCEAVVQASQAYLVTRLVHFLSCVFPQLQNLVYCSAAGLLLLLVAISSYPLQPRGLILLFNWIVILTFVGIAVLVFVRMNRNVVLSNLNGTKPGQVNWDREFIFRLFFYGVVPILALLGAQFPESVGEIITRILPASAGHP